MMNLSHIALIAGSESKIIIRNKVVLASAILIPAAFIISMLYAGGQGTKSWTLLYIVTFTTLPMLTLYSTATITLASRRQELFLKRLRSGRINDSSILMGLLTPITVIMLTQMLLILGASFIVGAPLPVNAVALFIAIFGIVFIGIGVSIFTSVFTPNASAAQFTVLPFSFLVMGSAIWMIMPDDGSYQLAKNTLPGSAAAKLIIAAWDSSIAWSAILIPAISLIAWAVIPTVIGIMIFRWEPRK